MSLPLVACAQASAYTIKDSRAPASTDGAVIWLDNQRVLFYRLKVAEKNEGITLESLVWDTATGNVSPYPALQGTAKVCVHGNFISYIRRKPSAEKEWLLVYGKVHNGQIVEEQVTSLPNQYQINPFSCRYYASPPPWAMKGRITSPLLEEHGYLDLRPVDNNAPLEKVPIVLYRPGAAEGIQLAIPRGGLGGPISYDPFRNAYLIPSERYRDPMTGVVQQIGGSWPKGKPLPVWWLTPEGKITEEQIPYAPFMARGSRGFFPVKVGIFVWSHAIAVRGGPGDAGGYVVRDGTIQKLITGMVHSPVISPDGCKVVFVHDPYDTEFPKDRADRITVKVIDLCEGGNHG
jgi:hypothetical protein